MPFHIHVPKPLHGWHKAKDGEERLKIELKSIARLAAERIATSTCVQTQLHGLEARLLASKETMDPLPFVQDGYGTATVKMPRRPWNTQTWESLQQDGTTNYLSSRQQQLLGAVYQSVSILRADARQTDERRGKLAITSLPIQLTPEIKADLLRDIFLVAAMNWPRRSSYLLLV